MATTYDIVRDTFTRTVTDDWGRADNGTDWEIVTGTPANFDVNGSSGTIVLTAALANHNVSIPGNFKNVKGFLRLSVSAVATGSSIVSDVLMRWVDNNNFVAARVEHSTTNIVAVIYKVVAGVVTTMQTQAISGYAANDIFNFRFELTDSVLRTKLWFDTQVELNTWDTSGSVSNILGAGRIILQTRRESGNTNTNPVLSFQHFEVTSTIPTIEVVPQLLQDYEFKFGQDDNAIILNNGAASATVGTPIWDVQKVTGLDLPDVKVSDKEFDGIDGGVVEASNISMRTVRLEGVLYAHQDDSLEGYLDRLKTNYAPVPRQANGMFFDASQKPFFIKPPGVTERFLFAKSVGLKYDWDMARRFNSTPFQIILQAQVPTLFSPQLHMVTANLTANVEQRLAVPARLGRRPGRMSRRQQRGFTRRRPATLTGVTNAKRPWWQIGNTPTVYLRHLEQATNLDLALGIPTSLANRPVEINMRQRTVFAVDTPPENHRDDVQAEGWWRLQPGMNTIAVTTSVSNSGYVELLWRDEWF